MAQSSLAASTCLLLLRYVAAFNLYPPVNPDMLAKAYNLTTGCLQALNESLPDCDQTLFQMVGTIDNYYWEDDNVTTLCAGNCSYAATMWDLDVTNACDGQFMSAYGKLIPAESISGRFVDGMNIVCLASTTNDSWCLIESQEWVGSDVIRPDCNVNPSDPACSSNATDVNSADQRMANLYSNDVLCNYCFSQMLYLRVTSPYLPDTDYSDYLVDQLQDIADICSISIPNITVRALPTYPSAPPVTSINFRTTTTTTATTSPTCTGQTIGGPQKRSLQVRGRSIEVRQEPSTCNTLSTKYGVTTGDLQAITQSDTCAISGSICLPAACSLQQVPVGATCDSLASIIPGNVTTIQFLNWNPNIVGLCDSPTPGQYICIGAPGGTYTLAAPPLGTDADAGNQQRGGPGGIVTPTTTVTTIVNSASEGSASMATQSGIAAKCNNYAKAKKGDDCYDFALAHSITPDQLYAWNTILGARGANCSLQFQAGEYYCIGISSTTTATITSTSTTTSGGNPVTAPGPTQTGIDSSCNKYAEAQSGDNCANFAKSNGISTDQLYAWNSVLGANGANCNTQFWAMEFYCVGVSGDGTGTTMTG